MGQKLSQRTECDRKEHLSCKRHLVPIWSSGPEVLLCSILPPRNMISVILAASLLAAAFAAPAYENV
jgi:hypothetical protein